MIGKSEQCKNYVFKNKNWREKKKQIIDKHIIILSDNESVKKKKKKFFTLKKNATFAFISKIITKQIFGPIRMLIVTI